MYDLSISKTKEISFVCKNNVASKSSDLVHCDIWGPYHVNYYKGHHYFVTIVDEHSRLMWIYLIKHKPEVQHIIPKFFSMVLNQFGAHIKVYRSENAQELKFFDFLYEKGVLHQF